MVRIACYLSSEGGVLEKLKIMALGLVGILPVTGFMGILFVGEQDLFGLLAGGGWLLALPFYVISVARNKELSGFSRVMYLGSFFIMCPSMVSYPLYWLLQVLQPYRERKMMEAAFED